MRHSLILGLSALLASLPAAALPEPDELFTPTVYAGVSFGGAGGADDHRLGLRLDGARLPALADAPALMQWELRPGGAALAIAGQTLVAPGSRAPGYAEGERGGAGPAIALGLLGTAAVVGAVAWALDEAFDEDFGDALAGAMVEETFGAEVEDGGEESDPPPCTGVEVGDACVGGR